MAAPPQQEQMMQQIRRRREVKMDPAAVSDREHDFALVLTGITELTREAEEALFEAGCDDATLSVRSGRVYLTFSRSAPTAKDAILSAIRDVRKANIGADVLRVDESNLVSQADIARKIERKRQQVHQYITGERGPGNFPAPACRLCDDSPLWYWSEVAYWLLQNDMIKEDVYREAEELAFINTALELKSQRQLDPALAEEVFKSLASSR
jgi:hypothetical protein